MHICMYVCMYLSIYSMCIGFNLITDLGAAACAFTHYGIILKI